MSAPWRAMLACPQASPVFLPASFDLVEFDDAMTRDQEPSTRLLLHANGLAIEPAEQVLLGWIGTSGSQVTTATRRYSGPVPREESGRSDATYLAGSLAPDGAGAALLPLQEWAQLHATSGADDFRWHQTAVVLNDQPTQAEVIDVESGSFGWLTSNDLMIAFTVRNLPVRNLRLRTVSQISATRYPCNPLTPRTWRDFIDSNQA